MASNSLTTNGIKTSFTNTPQAGDDIYSTTEDSLLSGYYSGVTYNDTTHILTLDVMSNDLGGAAKTLFSIDDGNGHTDLTDYDLLSKDTAGVWETSASGNRIEIVNGKINLDISHYLASLGVDSINALGAGDSFHDEFVYAIRLSNGTLSQARVTVNIQGLNDAASIGGDHDGSVTEDGPLTDSGVLTVSDVDRGENHAQVVGPTDTGKGIYSVDADGTWHYTLHNGAAQHLGAGVHDSDSFVVTSADGTAQRTVTVDIVGVNDLASISGVDTGSVTEDGALTAAGTLTVSDADDGESSMQAASGSSTKGSWAVDADGNWTYTLNNDAAQHLGAGVHDSDSFVVTSADGTAQRTVTVDIVGVNDLASISGVDTGSVTEDGALAAAGTLTVSDADDGESTFAASDNGTHAGLYGTFTFDAATGEWSYALDNSNATVQALNASSAPLHDTLTVHAFDGSDTDTIDVTINGADDPIQAAPPADAGKPTAIAFVPDESGNSLNPLGRFVAMDPDGADTLTWSAVSDSGITVDSNGNLVISGAATAGTHRLSVTVTDPDAPDGTTYTTDFTLLLGSSGNVADTMPNGTTFVLSGTNNIEVGLNGDDPLTGSAGIDYIIGGSQNDVIKGLGGADVLQGGSGNDRYVYLATSDSAPGSHDTIVDFVHGSDKIDVSLIDSGAVGGAFTFNGTTATAHGIWYEENGGNTILHFDTDNATGVDEMTIVLSGTSLGLASSDFLL